MQGIAVDLERGYIYFSFTTKLLKMDLAGNLIGSVDGLTGHLGCLTMNPADGRVYGSLEYKDDAIGKGIRKTLDGESEGRGPDGILHRRIRRGPHRASRYGCGAGPRDDGRLCQGGR